MSEPVSPSPSPEPPPPPPPSQGSPGPSAAAQSSAGGASQANAIGEAKAGGDFNLINEQKNIQVENLKLVGQYVEEELLFERTFTHSDAPPLADCLADELIETYVGDETLFAKLMRQLDECRILLLTGEHDIGKRTVALHLALRIAEKRALVVESLERRISIDLGELAGDGAHFGNRATVFVDAFDHNNRKLRSFFVNASSIRWTQLAESLRRNQAYLIFTSWKNRAVLNPAVAHHELQQLPGEKVSIAIEQRLTWMKRQSDVVTERIELLTRDQNRLIEELQTLPRIASFMKQFVRDDTDLDSALRRFREVPYWFSTTLDRDVTTWAFVLTLALAQPTRDARAASWADFERLRRAITERMRTDPEFTVRRGKTDTADEPERANAPSFSDDLLLVRCRARIGEGSDRLGDVAQFEHPSLLRELWQTLLTHHRRALMAILPALTSVAEENDDWSARVLAAQAIGRLGEIDPRRIAVPLIHRWSSSDDKSWRPLVGRMLQGVLGSANVIYREFMVGQIRDLAGLALSEDEDEINNNLLTAIGAYAQIGVYERDLAMDGLGKIVSDYLAPIVADVHALERAMEAVDTILTETTSKHAARGLVFRRLRLSRFADRLLAAHAPALLAVEQAVAHLCRIHDPVQILRKMRKWSENGGEGTTSLVALLFVYDGIASDLQTSSVLSSVMANTDATQQFCGFLADVHESINGVFTIAATLQRELQEKFNVCLTSWAADAVDDAELRPAAIGFFVALAQTRSGALQKDISALLETEAFTQRRTMQRFADEVRSRLKPDSMTTG